MFTFTPLYGAQNDSPASSSLLELDEGIKILVDLGWDSTFSANALQEVEKHASTLSFVLLTHPTLDHLGAYAHACKHIPLFNRIPVYATIPVINLGLTLLTDLYASSPSAASTVPITAVSDANDGENAVEQGNILLQAPTPEEISRCFNRITPLKYSQPHQPTPSQFSPPLNNLTITAYAAGHTLGGTIWHLQHGMESIVYATDWKQGRENLLGGAAWLASSSGGAEIIEALRRPTALICSSRGIEIENPLTKKKRDDQLISLVRYTLEQGGKVLIATDSSARMLELAFLLNKTWQDNPDGPYKNARLFMASRSASSTKRYLQSMLEWMDDTVIRDTETAMTSKTNDKVTNPLDWKFVRVVERQRQLRRALERSKPGVILASGSDLDWGFSREAIETLAADSRNLVVLTDEVMSASSIGAQLKKTFESQPGAAIVASNDRTITLRSEQTTALNENERIIYDQYFARQQALTNDALPTDGLAEGANIVDADTAASDSSDSEDDEFVEDATAQQQGRALNLSTQLSSARRKVGLTDAEMGVDILLTMKTHDYDVQGKRGREKMYPFRTTRKRDDDFGETIVVGDYLRAEEKEELDADSQGNAQDRKLGEKRKWDDASSGPGAKGKKAGAQNKRTKVDREPDDIDAAIAKATGENVGGDGTNGAEPATDSDDSEYDPDDDETASSEPRKLVISSTEIPMSARVAYVDFSARHERRDLLMLIPLIRPRKLILTCGNEAQIKMLAEETRTLFGDNDKSSKSGSVTEVYTPHNGEQIDASVDTNAWMLKLGRSLLRRLVWQDIRGVGVVALTGLLQNEPEEAPDEAVKEEDENARKKRKLAKAATEHTEQPEKQKEHYPVLDLPDGAMSARSQLSSAMTAVNRPIHVGDLRLSDLRNLLRASGHMADFRGEGTLLVDGMVVVRKGAGGRIEVEGGVYGVSARGLTGESVFGEVKRKVYEGLAVVGGGHVAAA